MTLQTYVPTFPAFPTLTDAITKCRKLTATTNNFQLTNSQIVTYMNSFYSYDLPSKFRSLKLKDFYTFTTNAGQETYPFNSEIYTTVDMPCYCAKREIKLYNDPWNFYGVNFNWQQVETFSTGNGTSGSRMGTITNVTNASNAVVTSANHGLVTGSRVAIASVVGMLELNGNSYTITTIDINSFYLNVNSSLYNAYVSGGTWATSIYNGQTIASPLVPSINNDPGEESNPSLYFPQSRVQNLLITANAYGPNGIGQTQNVTDDGNGNLIQIFQTANQYSPSNNSNQEYGWTYYRQYASATPNVAGSATINYQTGQITGLNFSLPIPMGTPIQIQYNSRILSMPLAIMLYQNQFTLAPTPDAGYTIQLTAYRSPIKALLAQSQSGNPELSEWWEILAVGAAKKIFEDRLDTEGVVYIDKMLKERYDIIETRTYAAIGQRQIYTIYTDQTTYNYSNNGFGAYFGGP